MFLTLNIKNMIFQSTFSKGGAKNEPLFHCNKIMVSSNQKNKRDQMIR